MKKVLDARALGVLALMLLLALSAAAAIDLSKGGPPAITVTGVQLNPPNVTCGVENHCARVTWTAVVPGGTSVSSWNVTLKVTKSDGVVETHTKTALPAAARQVDMAAAFQSGSPVSYNVDVTAKYSSSANGNKSENF